MEKVDILYIGFAILIIGLVGYNYAYDNALTKDIRHKYDDHFLNQQEQTATINQTRFIEWVNLTNRQIVESYAKNIGDGTIHSEAMYARCDSNYCGATFNLTGGNFGHMDSEVLANYKHFLDK